MIAPGARGELLRRAVAAEPVLVHLYRNAYTQGPDTPLTRDALTEVTGADYAPQRILPAHWVIDGDEVTAPAVRWEFTQRHGWMYGYFVTGAESGLLLWAERFVDGPYRIEAAEDALTIDPRVGWLG